MVSKEFNFTMSSIDCISSNNQVLFNKFDRSFKCDFCPNTFHTEDNFNGHVLEHFERKNCTDCNKFVIRIGSKWYELHVDDYNVNDFDDQKDESILDSITEVKVEECDDVLEFDDSNGAEQSFNDTDFESENDSNEECDKPIQYQKAVSKRKIQTTDKKKETGKKIKLTEDSTSKDTEKSQKTGGSQPRRRGGRLARVKCRICDRIILQYKFDEHLQKMHIPNIIVPSERIKCETCGKSFANAGNLKTHQAIHSETRRFVCSYCGTSFRQLYHLTEHMNAHTGAKPYHCEICDKRFGRLHILRAHQRVHTGEKPHKCTIDGCDRAYAYDIDLKRHKFSAHGIYTKKHICSFCSKVFPENKLLKKHLESHSAGNIRRIATKSDE